MNALSCVLATSCEVGTQIGARGANMSCTALLKTTPLIGATLANIGTNGREQPTAESQLAGTLPILAFGKTSLCSLSNA
jgi:hypothetical protein